MTITTIQLNIKEDFGYVQKIVQMLKTSLWEYEKLSAVTYLLYFINWQSMHKTNIMQSIEKVSMWEVFSSICPL